MSEKVDNEVRSSNIPVAYGYKDEKILTDLRALTIDQKWIGALHLERRESKPKACARVKTLK